MALLVEDYDARGASRLGHLRGRRQLSLGSGARVSGEGSRRWLAGRAARASAGDLTCARKAPPTEGHDDNPATMPCAAIRTGWGPWSEAARGTKGAQWDKGRLPANHPLPPSPMDAWWFVRLQR